MVGGNPVQLLFPTGDRGCQTVDVVGTLSTTRFLSLAPTVANRCQPLAPTKRTLSTTAIQPNQLLLSLCSLYESHLLRSRAPHEHSLATPDLSTYGELHPCNARPWAAILHRRCASASPCCNGLVAAMTSQISDGMGNFAMLPLEPEGPLLVALREGQLHPRDLAILWCLVARLDWRSGRAYATTADLAAAIGHEQTNTVCGALARLRRLGLVAKAQETRDRRRIYWCVNPFLVAATGGKHRRQLQLRQFAAALE